MKHTAKTIIITLGLTATSLLATGAEGPAGTVANTPYPEGYRQWQHIKSMVIQPGHALFASFGGIHHLYGNPTAVQGYARGRFPDGSVIVFDLLEASSGDSAIVEGPRKVLGVMLKDGKRFAATGGWGFEAWAGGDPGKPVVGDTAASACFNCHTSQKDGDFVFSRLR